VVLSGRAQLSAHSPSGHSLRFVLRGRGTYTRRVLDPALRKTTRRGGAGMQAFAQEAPGGEWDAHAEGRADEHGLFVEFEIVLTATQRTPMDRRSNALLHGTFALPRDGKPALHAKIDARAPTD
jgi:hypothetical protein